MKIRSFKSFLNTWLSRAAGVLILQSIFLVPCGSVWGDTTWTWTNTGTAGQWNSGTNWTKSGDATTAFPERYSSNQTINIASGTANNGAIDLDFTDTTINITGTGAFKQTTTHYSRLYSGALNVTNGGSATMGATFWGFGMESANNYSVLVDGGSFTFTNTNGRIELGTNKAQTTITIQETLGKDSTFSVSGQTYLGRYDGSTGIFNMSAGTATFSNTLYIGDKGTGTLNLTGGTVTAGTVQVGTAGSSINVGSGGDMTTGALTNAGTVKVEAGGSLATGGIVNTGTVTQTGELTLLNGATINSLNGTYTTGGSVKLASDYSIVDNSVIRLGLFSNADTAQQFYEKLDATTTSGKAFKVQSVSGSNGSSGLSILLMANDAGTEISDQMILHPGTNGPMSDSANWVGYSAEATGYIIGGTNKLTNMFTNVEAQGGTNTYAAGFVIGAAADKPESLTISGGTNTFGKHLYIGNGANTTGALTISSEVSMAASGKNERQVFLGSNGGTGSLTINAGGMFKTNTGEDFVIAFGSNSTGTLTLNGGSLNHNGNFIVGGSSAGVGKMVVKSGTVNVGHMSIGQLADNSTGELTIEGGTITTANGFRVGFNNGSTGTVTMTDGNVFVGGSTGNSTIALGDVSDDFSGTGTFNLSGGTVKAASLTAGTKLQSVGVMNISGGALNLSGGVVIGGGERGELNISGGSLTASGATTINGTGTVTLTGGTLSTTEISNAGTLVLSGGTLANATAINNTGTVDFREGTFALPAGLTLTNNGGTIAVSGYSLVDFSAGVLNPVSGTYQFGNSGSTPKTGDSFVLAKVADQTTASSLTTNLTMPTGWQYTSSDIAGATYVFAAYGQAPTAGKIWKSGTTGKMSDSVNWENYSADAVGYVVGGANTFNNIVGKTIVSGGTNSFSSSLSNGAELTTTGGVNTFNAMTLGSGVGGAATLNISGGNNTISVQDTYLGLQGGQGTVNQTGGTSTWSGWMNIGETRVKDGYANPEGYAGTYLLSGGTMTTNGFFIVGRRGTGYMEISGSGKLIAKSDSYIGYFPEQSADSELKMAGGSASFTNLYIANNSGNAKENANQYGTSRMTVEGGSFATTGNVYVSHSGPSNNGGVGVLTIANEGQTNTIGGELYIGYGANTDGTAAISGGTTTVMSNLFVGNAADSQGTLNVSGGTLNLYKTNKIGNSGVGEINLTGGEIRCLKLPADQYASQTHIGSGSASGSGTLTISGGTFYAAGSDFILGNAGAAATMTVKGTFDADGKQLTTGTFDQRGKGNLVITGTNANGGAGSVVNLEKGGVIDVFYFSMGQNTSGDNPACTLNMTGGDLKITGGNFRIAAHDNETKAIVNLSGGTVTATGATQLDLYQKSGSQLNVIGPNVTFKGNTADFKSTGFLNYSVGTLTEENAVAGKLLSNLKFTGTATIASQVNIDMNFDGVVSVNTTPTQTILTAGTLNWNPAGVTISEYWGLTKDGNSITVSLLDDQLPTAQAGDMIFLSPAKDGVDGWTKITGTAGQTYAANMLVTGAEKGQMDALAAYLNEQAINEGLTFTAIGDRIEIGGLKIGVAGVSYLSFDVSGFNAAQDTGLRLNNIPEPSTWSLLILGAFGLALWRKRKAGK